MKVKIKNYDKLPVYLSLDKEYEVLWSQSYMAKGESNCLVEILNDIGEKLIVKFYNCAHINGDWEVVKS